MRPLDSRTSLFCLLFAIGALSLLPFLGLTDYHTKGEPRESLVAVSMLNDGNWVLPVNSGGDIAYKPPMFHWSVAALSALQGEVTEGSSRLPSALALIVLSLVCFLFYAKRVRPDVAFLSMLIFLSAFEVHRAGMASRVDMALTLFLVWGLLQLYKWYEHGLRGFPFWATLLMGAAALTKGPVGILLPCGVAGCFLLLRGVPFFRALWKLGVTALISCLLPAIWYYLAYRQGGDAFLSLILEENFGRFLGKMSYESHEQPVVYYLYITLAGFLPWSLLLLFSLFGIRFRKPEGPFRAWWLRTTQAIRDLSPARLFSLVSIVVMVLFYSIPKSKRSVYLLPIYPFLSLFIAEYLLYLIKNRPSVWRAFGKLIAALTVLLLLALGALRTGLVPERFSPDLNGYIASFKTLSFDFRHLFYTLLPVIALYLVYRYRKGLERSNRYLYAVVALFFCLQSMLDAVVLPTVLNRKSMRPFAEKVIAAVPEGPLYSYVSAPMMRFFIVNFYSGDRILDFEKERPASGYLLAGEKDFARLQPGYAERYRFEPVLRSERKGNDVKDIIRLYRFEQLSDTIGKTVQNHAAP